jgi:hypothetical protein
MSKLSRLTTVVLAVPLALGLGGCDSQREPTPVGPQPVQSDTLRPARKAGSRVVVPAEVEGKWRAVKIAVLDKTTGRETVHTVAIGGQLALAGDIVLQVRNFLPAFIMEGTVLTSVSNETRNPAAQIVVTEGEKEVYRGWLFSLYPGTHAFQHPQYSFTLVDFVPAGAKKD